MTRNRKANMQAITPLEQTTLFTYRRRKSQFWKLKGNIQQSKKKLAHTFQCKEQGFPRMYRVKYPYKVNHNKRNLQKSGKLHVYQNREKKKEGDNSEHPTET